MRSNRFVETGLWFSCILIGLGALLAPATTAQASAGKRAESNSTYAGSDGGSVQRSDRATTDVREPQADVPTQFALESNYPNPFNPTTTIGFSVPRAADVRLTVYDALGRKVAVLVDGVRAAGRHEVTFHADELASGLYVYRLEAAGHAYTRKMTLQK